MSVSSSGPDTGDRTLEDQLGGARNVLLLSPSMHEAGHRACNELLSWTAPEESRALRVDFRRTPGQLVDDWKEHVGALPEELTIVTFSDTRDWAEAKTVPDIIETDALVVKRVSFPGNLTEMGIVVSDVLERWMWEREPGVVCFDSVTSLLQFTDVGGTYRFLHLMTDRVSAIDARAHYHLDPESHDEQVVNKFKTLFDAAVRADDAGGYLVDHW